MLSEPRNTKRGNSEFAHKLLSGLVQDCYKFQYNNNDYLRFKTSLSSRIMRRFKDKVLRIAARKGFVRRHFDIEMTTKQLTHILANLDKYENLYLRLNDNYSRRLLIELLKFKILGLQHTKLPLNNRDYWEKVALVNGKIVKERHTRQAGKWNLNRYEIEGLSGPLHLHLHPYGVLGTFLLEHYAYVRNDNPVRVGPGDVVIDAGGCWGDTALYFADRTGEAGRVYCFEFDRNNLEILEQNFNMNTNLVGRIKLVQRALWDQSGQVLNYCPVGPGTTLMTGDADEQQHPQASTLALDDFVKEEGITKIDFVKMDIEGSELRALQGAVNTIREYKPRLAISVYHKNDDLITIPEYIMGLGLNYQFFLDHFSIHGEETVLFASPVNN